MFRRPPAIALRLYTRGLREWRRSERYAGAPAVHGLRSIVRDAVSSSAKSLRRGRISAAKAGEPSRARPTGNRTNRPAHGLKDAARAAPVNPRKWTRTIVRPPSATKVAQNDHASARPSPRAAR